MARCCAKRKGDETARDSCNDAGELLLDEYGKLFNSHTKLVAIAHVSNALGTINPVKDMIATAHQHGVTRNWLMERKQCRI